MIALPAGVKVHLALGHTDMRNYVERRIMRNPGRFWRTQYQYISRLWPADQAFQSA
jgi:hypothetical protein